jgi:hypothetical protein
VRTITDERGRLVHVCYLPNGETWYCQEGGTIVNQTFGDVREGTNLLDLFDLDCMTSAAPIRCPGDIQKNLTKKIKVREQNSTKIHTRNAY